MALLQSVHSPVHSCFMECEHHFGVQGSGTALTSRPARLPCRTSARETTVARCNTPLLLFVQASTAEEAARKHRHCMSIGQLPHAQCSVLPLFSPQLGGRLQPAPLDIHTGQAPLHATAVWFRAQRNGLQPLIRNPSQSIRVWTYCRAAPEVLAAMRGNRRDGRRRNTAIGPAADGVLIAAQTSLLSACLHQSSCPTSCDAPCHAPAYADQCLLTLLHFQAGQSSVPCIMANNAQVSLERSAYRPSTVGLTAVRCVRRSLEQGRAAVWHPIS